MIRLRRLSREDAAWICVRWTGGQALPGYRLPEEEGEVAALIDEWNRGEAQDMRFEMLLIEAKGRPAGLLSLLDRGSDVSFGISVHPSVQNCGVGTGAVRLAAEYVRRWKRDNLISECRKDNPASIRMHEKSGFQRAGERLNRKGNWVICWKMPLNEAENENE